MTGVALWGCSGGTDGLMGCSWAYWGDDINSPSNDLCPGTGNNVPPVATGVSGTELSLGPG